MTDTEKEQIRNAIASGRFVLLYHARVRMDERNITHDDIRNVGHTAYSLEEQDNGRLRVAGFGVDGSALDVIAVNDGEVLVITVY